MTATHRSGPIIVVTDVREQTSELRSRLERATDHEVRTLPATGDLEDSLGTDATDPPDADGETAATVPSGVVLELDCPGEIQTILQRVHARMATVPTIVAPPKGSERLATVALRPTRPTTCRRPATRTRSIGSSRRSGPSPSRRRPTTADITASSQTSCPTKRSSSARTAPISRRRPGPIRRTCTRRRPTTFQGPNSRMPSPLRSPRSYRTVSIGRSERTTSSRSSTTRRRPKVPAGSRPASSRSTSEFRDDAPSSGWPGISPSGYSANGNSDRDRTNSRRSTGSTRSSGR